MLNAEYIRIGLMKSSAEFFVMFPAYAIGIRIIVRTVRTLVALVAFRSSKTVASFVI